LLAGHDPAGDLQTGQGLGVGAGSQDDVLAGQLSAGDLDDVLGDQATLAFDILDALGLHQALQALVEASDDTVLVGIDAVHVDRLEGGLDAELRTLAGGVGDLRRMQQRFGRDTTHVEAGAAQLALLDQGDGQPQLGGPQRAGVTAAASTQNDDVERVLGGSRHGGRSLASAHLCGRRPRALGTHVLLALGRRTASCHEGSTARREGLGF